MRAGRDEWTCSYAYSTMIGHYSTPGFSGSDFSYSQIALVSTQRGGACPRTAHSGARRTALVTAHASAPERAPVRGHPLAAGFAVNKVRPRISRRTDRQSRTYQAE